MPNPLYSYISNMICKHILLIMLVNKPKLILLLSVKWFQVLVWFLCLMAYQPL